MDANKKYITVEQKSRNISNEDTEWMEALETFLESTDSFSKVNGKAYAKIYERLLAFEIS